MKLRDEFVGSGLGVHYASSRRAGSFVSERDRLDFCLMILFTPLLLPGSMIGRKFIEILQQIYISLEPLLLPTRSLGPNRLRSPLHLSLLEHLNKVQDSSEG